MRIFCVFVVLCLIYEAAAELVWQETAILGDPSGTSDDWFGHGVAIADGILVVGAPNKNSAFIYELVGDEWSEQAVLTSTDHVGLFGYSVAVHNGIVAVASSSRHAFESVYGSLHIFGRAQDGSWMERTKLIASGTSFGDGFGHAAVIKGSTLVVGAPWTHDEVSGSLTPRAHRFGAVYVFTFSESGWTEQVKITASDGVGDDSFGQAVAFDEGRLVVGAPQDDELGKYAGAVYLFQEISGRWTEKAKITATSDERHNRFGRSLDILGDTIVVGSWNYFDDESALGAVHVFKVMADSWSEQAKLVLSNAEVWGAFGVAVMLHDDVLFAGAPAMGAGGCTFVFALVDGSWTEQGKLMAIDARFGDGFGYSLASDGTTLIIGAPGRNFVQVFEELEPLPSVQRSELPSTAPHGSAGRPSVQPTIVASRNPTQSSTLAPAVPPASVSDTLPAWSTYLLFFCGTFILYFCCFFCCFHSCLYLCAPRRYTPRQVPTLPPPDSPHEVVVVHLGLSHNNGQADGTIPTPVTVNQPTIAPTTIITEEDFSTIGQTASTQT